MLIYLLINRGNPMSLSKNSLFTFIGILTLCTTPMFATLEASDTETTATEYTADCASLAAFYDAEVMAMNMADPNKFMLFVAQMSKPETTQAFMDCSTNPEQWNTWMASMSNPTKMMNAFAMFMNPQVYMNWMAASMNPQTYQVAMNTYMNPALYMQWMTAASNPAYYQSMYKMMDPKWQQQSTAWMMNPNNYQQMFTAMTAPVVADTTVTQ